MTTALIRLTDTPPRGADLGNKFTRLAELRHLAPIPPAWCIPAGTFATALGPARIAQLGQLTCDMADTVGSDLTGWEWQTAKLLTDLHLPTSLHRALAQVVTDNARAWAVRSSTSLEDGNTHSHAGLYDTHLNITGSDAVANAIVACWRSFYSLRATWGRIRAGDTDPTPRIAVIVQQQVLPDRSGVAFTSPSGVIIDAVDGDCDQLVSGRSTATRIDTTFTADLDTPFNHVRALAKDVQQHVGFDIDIEWASNDDTVWLLQARPVTVDAAMAPATTHSPVFTSRSLYFPESGTAQSLGVCASVHHAMTSKRAPIYRLARQAGIHVDDGWVITFNGRGLAETTLHPTWWTNLTGHVVVDLGTSARQNIMPSHQLPDFLINATGGDRDCYTLHHAIVRPFRYGEAGAVSRCLPDGRVIVDHSYEGLMAINRGMAATVRLTLPAHTDDLNQHIQPPQRWTIPALRDIAAFTRALHQQHPGAYAEWCITDGHLTFVDYTIPNNPHAAPTASDAAMLSPGTVHAAPLLALTETEQLERLSVAPIVSINDATPTSDSLHLAEILTRATQYDTPPVVYVARPYAILSLLFDHVAGFVFDGGSTLCHLAILLREAGIPAVIANKPLHPQHINSVSINDGTLLIS